MYRNLHYNIAKKYVRLWTWDERGKRVQVDIPFSPYIYLETESNADAMSIFNTKLRKRAFKNEWDRRRYVKESGLKRIFYNIPVEQQFLIDHFKFQNSEDDFSQHPLKIFYLDIEVYSPDEFPDPEIANKEINIITIYDSLDGKFHTWGTSGQNGGEYAGPDNVVYTSCKSERELLVKFLEYWRKDFPDIITGWNSQSFDIPYLVNRLNNVFGEDRARLLSPIGELYKRENVLTKFGKHEDHYYIKGVSHIDYMEAYKVFEKDNRERYSLDYIGNHDLNEGKIPIPSSELHKVADTDWQTFCDYNIQDVNIIVKLEKAKHYLDIVRMLSYMGYTSFERALGTVAMVTGAFAVKALEENTIIPTFEHKDVKKFEGGFVRVPQRGINEGIVSFDANSLYPNTIIGANISPETKLGKIITKTKKEVVVELVNGKRFPMTPEKFLAFVEKEQLAITKARILYTQKKRGFCPKMLDGVYAERVKNKNEMLERKRNIKKCKEGSDKYKEHEKRIVELDVMQYTLKILMNRVYGTFGNKHSPFYDIDAAGSVTLTGQACVKEAANITSKFMKKYGVEEDCTVYGDTDSVYITIKPVLDALDEDFAVDFVPTKRAYEIAEELETFLNQEITTWAKKTCNMNDPRFVFKRETMCNSGIFMEKKKYILHVLDNEGVLQDKIKPTGVELVKIEIPAKIKPLMLNIVDTMMRSRDYKKTNKEVRKLYEQFMAMEPEEVAKTVGIKQLDKYAINANGFQMPKRTTIQAKSAMYYNHLLNEMDLAGKYEKIEEGIHMKYFFVQPNKYNIQTIGFIDRYPKEFGLEIDRNKTFNKNIFPTIKRIYDAVNWRPMNPSAELAVDLIDLLG